MTIEEEIIKYLPKEIVNMVNEIENELGDIKLTMINGDIDIIEDTDFRYYSNASNVVEIKIIGRLTINTHRIFSRYENLKGIYGNLPIITTDILYGLFMETKIENGNIGSWDVSNVTNMQSMFYHTKYNHPLNGWRFSERIYS